MGNMTSSLPTSADPSPPLPSPDNTMENESENTSICNPATTNTSTKAADENIEIQNGAIQVLTHPDRDAEDTHPKLSPLHLLDLPLDILKDIVKEVSIEFESLSRMTRIIIRSKFWTQLQVTYTNDLTSLALACSALNDLATPLIYSRFDIVWPDAHNTADSHQGVDALTYGLATLVMGEDQSNRSRLPNYCGHCGMPITLLPPRNAMPRRRRNHYPQYTRKFSIGNGRGEWVKEYMINQESGKMLGTLVALAIARMPNLETFIWDMPTGILRDCWLALSSLTKAKDSSSPTLEKVWIRFHDNSEIVAASDDHPRRLPQTVVMPESTASDPSQTQWSSAISTTPYSNRLAWSYRFTESPSFSLLPALRSLNVLDIDELAYLEEMSVLLKRSIESLRELRVGFSIEVPKKGFASSRTIEFEKDTSDLSTYEGALGLLMSKIYTASPDSYSAVPHPDYKIYVGNTRHPVAYEGVLDNSTQANSNNGHHVDSADVLSSLVVRPSGNRTSEIPEVDATKAPAVSPSTTSMDQNLSDSCQPLISDQSPEESQARTKLNTSSDTTTSYLSREPNSQQPKQLRLDVLELERVNLSVPAMLKAIDWSVVTTLTLLHCDSHEQLWKAFRRTYTPRLTSTTPPGSSLPVLRRKSRAQPRSPSASDPHLVPFSEYRLSLRKIHTNTVSLALIAFLKDTLAPNTLEFLFLQDGGYVKSSGSDGRSQYESMVTVEAILRGPLRRHRSSLKNLLIDSGHHSPLRNSKWQKWKLGRDALSYLTSGKLSALRELSFSLDYKDWHFLLQRLPQVPQIRSIYLPNIGDHNYGHHLVAKELALQVMDIVALRPDVELCYLGIVNKCFEIIEGTYNEDATVTFRDSAVGPVPGPGSIDGSDEDSDNDEDEDDEDHDDASHDQTADGGQQNNEDDSQDESFGESDAESEGDENEIRPLNLKLREILFYEEKILYAMAADRSVETRFGSFSLIKILYYVFFSLPLLRAAPLRHGPVYAFEEPPMSPHQPTLWIYMAVAIGLVLLGGAFAGLTIALMGQDEIYLQVIKTSGEPSEKKHAGRVLRLLKRGKHWVLVTLLLGNVITNETLPIVLDRSLGGGWPAVLGSTVLIGVYDIEQWTIRDADSSLVIFGEIIPQSICVRYGLPIGAYLSPLVLVLMYILSPVAWPTAKLLDKLLGEDHGTTYKKAGLKTLVTLHKSLGAAGEQLNSDEVTIISAVLDLKAKPIGSIMTPIKDVFTMSSDTVLDEKTMDVILGAGYSRIPIHEPKNPQNYVGMLLVKILITYDPEDCKRVNEFALATLPETAPETSCLDIVNFFQEGKSHMVLVSERPGQDSGAIGVVTLEDVIEELIGEEIIDESDVYIDVHKAIRRTNVAPKTKIGKHGVVTESETNIAQAEENLIDVGEDNKPQHKALQRTAAGDLAANGSAPDNSPKGRNPNLRRTSSIASVTKDGQPKPLSNIDHFRHLGPSNLASRPRQTRYNTVKIKPGGGSLAENVVKANSNDNESSPLAIAAVSPAPHGGVGTGLLNSAGKDASDGVLAVHQGYGTTGGTPPNSSNGKTSSGGPSAASQAHPSATIPEEESHQKQRSRPSGTKEHSDSESTIGSLTKRKDVSPRQIKKRGTARSGSITEQIVDLGGVRKVVLETTSSSEENANGGIGKENMGGDRSEGGGVPVNERDVEEEGSVEGKKKGEGGGRKKRRRKKRKPAGEGKAEEGEGDEGAPLLGRRGANEVDD
ncbi:MAG: hypothetical protein Q9166_000162 [cf. Caloplaca sp. 2 TL-2023]